MYIYGIRSSSNLTPTISGNILNNIMFQVYKAMKIKQIFISDSAGIACSWDERISLDHFSILRVIGGKNTFYESLPGHFLNPSEAEKERAIIQDVSSEDKSFVKEYLKLDKRKNSEGCHRINHIIEQAMKKIKLNNDLLKYVMTPYS